MSTLLKLNGELAAVVDGIRPNLVQISNNKQSGGAGVVWNDHGLIITNAHVIAPSLRKRRRPLVKMADGSKHKANVIAVDKKRDLAALQLEGVETTGATIGNSATLRSGDWVTAIGHPWGVVGAATSGAVIAVGRPPEIGYDGAMLQVGLHMRPGHSGGAMVNGAGEVVGINCMIAGPNVGLAIPSQSVQEFLASSMNRA